MARRPAQRALRPTRSPHHVPKQCADRYKGQFDDGWDAYRERVFARQKELDLTPANVELSRHDPDVPTWDALAPQGRRLAARMMKVFAGFLSHTDHHIGRLIDFLNETCEFDNTLIMVVFDNGASAEGGITGTTNELQFSTTPPSRGRLAPLGGVERPRPGGFARLIQRRVRVSGRTFSPRRLGRQSQAAVAATQGGDGSVCASFFQCRKQRQSAAGQVRPSARVPVAGR
jgi:arylsulfatase A-like enzyme